MPVEYRDYDDRLVALDRDAAAVWQAGAWKVLGVEFARRARFEGLPLSQREAEKAFPDAKLRDVPDLDEAAREAEKAYSSEAEKAISELESRV